MADQRRLRPRSRQARIQAALTESKDRLFDDGERTTSAWADAHWSTSPTVPSTRSRHATDATGIGPGSITTPPPVRPPRPRGGRIPANTWRSLMHLRRHRRRRPPPRRRCRSVWVVRSTSSRTAPAASSNTATAAAAYPGALPDRFVEVHHIIHWQDGGLTSTPRTCCCLCPKHHRMHHQGLLGITGNADQPDGITFTDSRGSPIPPWHPPDPPDQPPTCDRPYDAPPAGRINYDWVGLGWAHPNALKQRAARSGQFRRG